jgi:hypothetical protein
LEGTGRDYFVAQPTKKEVGRRSLLSGLARNPQYAHKRPTREVGFVLLYCVEPGEFERKGTIKYLWVKVQNPRRFTKWWG